MCICTFVEGTGDSESNVVKFLIGRFTVNLFSLTPFTSLSLLLLNDVNAYRGTEHHTLYFYGC